MKFGVAIPTCTEGLLYPIPFASAGDILRVALAAERLGYHEVMGNDHRTTQAYVRQAFPDPPGYFEPMMCLAYCAARTTSIRLMTGVLVLPLRHPVLLAKQAATLDQLSGGRLTLGIGVGAYREELEATRPELTLGSRAELMTEGILALNTLLTERVSSFSGRWSQFRDVEMFPKPIQDPLPIFSGGNASASIRRAAQYCQGWLPASLTPERLAAGREQLQQLAVEAGRDPDKISVAPQMVVCLGADNEDAQRRFQNSRIFEHLTTLQRATLRGIDPTDYANINLVGDTDVVIARVQALIDAGADHLAGLLFVANTVEEMLEQMEMFREGVMTKFSEPMPDGRTA